MLFRLAVMLLPVAFAIGQEAPRVPCKNCDSTGAHDCTKHGKGMLENQRLVLSSIKHLINGANPPVHAVDSLVTRAPT